MELLNYLAVYCIGIITGIILLWLYICLEVSKEFVKHDKRKGSKDD